MKVEVAGTERLCVAEGHGPVDALSHALRIALEPVFPQLTRLHLVDYKVRVVNSADGTAAKVRVLIEHHLQGANGEVQAVETVGVDENILAASWEALTEAITFAVTASAPATADALKRAGV